MHSSRRQFFLWLAVAAVVCAVDLVSKRVVLASALTEGPVRVLPFFRLVLVENTGAAFGILADGGPNARAFLVAAPAVVVFGFALHLWLNRPPPGEALGFALVMGGAAGNLHDRVVRGGVVDFLDFHIGAWHWPAFNAADSAICVGFLLLLWRIFLFGRGKAL